MYQFQSFNITAVPRTKNKEAIQLATIASCLFPLEDYKANRFSIELMFWPSVPENITNWRVFEDDENIINYMTNKYTFKDSIIDNIEEHAKAMAKVM